MLLSTALIEAHAAPQVSDFVALPLTEGQGAITRFFGAAVSAPAPGSAAAGNGNAAGAAPAAAAAQPAQNARHRPPQQPSIAAMFQRAAAAAAPAPAPKQAGEVREPCSGDSAQGLQGRRGDAASSGAAERQCQQPAGQVQMKAQASSSGRPGCSGAAAQQVQGHVPAGHSAVAEEPADVAAPAAAKHASPGGRVEKGVAKQPVLEQMWSGKHSGSNGSQCMAAGGSGREQSGVSGQQGTEEVGTPRGTSRATDAPSQLAEEEDRGMSGPEHQKEGAAACRREHDGSAEQAAGKAGGGMDLEAVNVEEQRRIMRDIWLRNKQQQGGGGSGGKPPSPRAGKESDAAVGKRGRGSKDSGGAGKQLRISALFKAPRT